MADGQRKKKKKKRIGRQFDNGGRSFGFGDRHRCWVSRTWASRLTDGMLRPLLLCGIPQRSGADLAECNPGLCNPSNGRRFLGSAPHTPRCCLPLKLARIEC